MGRENAAPRDGGGRSGSLILGGVVLFLLAAGNMGAAACMLAYAISTTRDVRADMAPTAAPATIEVLDNTQPGDPTLDVREEEVRVHGTPRTSGTYRSTLGIGKNGDEVPMDRHLGTYVLKVTP